VNCGFRCDAVQSFSSYQRFGGPCHLCLQGIDDAFHRTLITTYKTTRRHNPENNNPQQLSLVNNDPAAFCSFIYLFIHYSFIQL
jgi:hypothetical protein